MKNDMIKEWYRNNTTKNDQEMTKGSKVFKFRVAFWGSYTLGFAKVRVQNTQPFSPFFNPFR